MRKKFCWVIILCMLTLCGCGQGAQESERSGVGTALSPTAMSDGLKESVPVQGGEGQVAKDTKTGPETAALNETAVSVSDEIQELEKGMSAVEYTGDYGLDSFLESGGAASDAEVLKFLTRNLMADADTEGLLFESSMFGCSTVSVKNTAGGWLFGRNFDWTACEQMVVTAYPENGYSSISTVNMDFIRQGAGLTANLLPDKVLTLAALYAPLDGMNEKGLCISVNMIQEGATISQNTGKPDITTTTAIRLVLDKAGTVQEALELLENCDLHASMNYMVHFAIADAEGNSVAVEYIDNEMRVTETPILTNFYVTEGEKQGIGTAQSHTRYETMETALNQAESMNIAQVRDVLDSVSKHNFGSHESTEWSIIFDQRELKAHYYHRENYEAGYEFAIDS